ncbi:hypothetical protein JNO63_06865 [Anaerococcus sp. mt242]|uniref:hypothetical protein n=1 Tax=Anaerococcus sp. mt242 TaxID=2661917 RepID=UPI00193496BD|nr:hypothetical protein [Anaerococcus sp. mt242]MBM0046810.1 hypothetical protein [Anaerococcus sp. mt242]
MKLQDIKQFLKFRQKFTKREWHEINEAVRLQENKRADQIVLDDSDIYSVIIRLNNSNVLELSIDEKLEFFEKVGSELDIFNQE